MALLKKPAGAGREPANSFETHTDIGIAILALIKLSRHG